MLWSDQYVFFKIPRLVHRLGSDVPQVRVSARRRRKVIFLSRMPCHVLEIFNNGAVMPLCAVACFLRTLYYRM